MQKNEINNLIRSMACAAIICAVAPAFAADGACDSDEAFINPALALCTTHVYNVGSTTNPSGAAEREMMKDVIALKTTVVTQQMYKQYEYLESMIKRFKTQLEKAVLTTKLQVASASSNNSSPSSGASSSNRNKYVILDSAKNCYNETTKPTVYECLQNNIGAVLSAVDEGKSSEAKRQLVSDIEVAVTWGVNKNDIKNCNNISSTPTITSCAYSFRAAISNALDKYNDERNKPQK